MFALRPKFHVTKGLLSLSALIAATPAAAHEAWLLTPSEIEALASEPMPAVFTSRVILLSAATLGSVAAGVALILEDRIKPIEHAVARHVEPLAQSIGALVLRLGLATMLILAAFGGLPRHGTAPWTQPTLFVPDMQLSTVPMSDWLILVQLALGTLFALGLATRISAVGLIGVTVVGLWLFGAPFLSYAPHFIAPALMLAVLGSGTLSVDRLMEDRVAPVTMPAPQMLWRLAQILVGLGFVYLAVAHKLLQPTLLIAILDHGNFPSFGVPLSWIALGMTGVEIICGALLALGRLTRPVALVLIGAISFLAITLGETPLFHANLYGMMLLLVMTGVSLPKATSAPAPVLRRVGA